MSHGFKNTVMAILVLALAGAVWLMYANGALVDRLLACSAGVWA